MGFYGRKNQPQKVVEYIITIENRTQMLLFVESSYIYIYISHHLPIISPLQAP